MPCNDMHGSLDGILEGCQGCFVVTSPRLPDNVRRRRKGDVVGAGGTGGLGPDGLGVAWDGMAGVPWEIGSGESPGAKGWATAARTTPAFPPRPAQPICYASPEFLQLTQYSKAQVLGRNCRFLQGGVGGLGCVSRRRGQEGLTTAVAGARGRGAVPERHVCLGSSALAVSLFHPRRRRPPAARPRDQRVFPAGAAGCGAGGAGVCVEPVQLPRRRRRLLGFGFPAARPVR